MSAIRKAAREGVPLGAGLRVAIVVFSAAAIAFAGSITLLAFNNQDQRMKDAEALARERAISYVARDQFCLLAERQQREDVRQLRVIYGFLKDLQPHERDDTLTKVILRQLPQYERAGLQDDSAPSRGPDLCDRKGLGLPEPDPRLPKRPRLPDFLPPAPRPVRGIVLERSSALLTPQRPDAGSRPNPQPIRPQRPEDQPESPSRPNPPPAAARPGVTVPPGHLDEPVTPPDVTKPPAVPEAPKACVAVPQGPVTVPETCVP